MTQPDFAQLYDQHIERIYRYLLARTGSVEEAEDLAAETFRAALESVEHFTPGPDAGAGLAWLIGIARHKLADHHRRGQRRQALQAALLHQPDLALADAEALALDRLELAQVAAALRRLNPERAEALALHYFGELKLAEVGRAMGKSEEAAKKLVQRGLSELRQQLAAAPGAPLAAKGAAR